ncbi:MAG: hypothetical protein ACLTJ8_07610 [Veillonella atypica]
MLMVTGVTITPSATGASPISTDNSWHHRAGNKEIIKGVIMLASADAAMLL